MSVNHQTRYLVVRRRTIEKKLQLRLSDELREKCSMIRQNEKKNQLASAQFIQQTINEAVCG